MWLVKSEAGEARPIESNCERIAIDWRLVKEAGHTLWPQAASRHPSSAIRAAALAPGSQQGIEAASQLFLYSLNLQSVIGENTTPCSEHVRRVVLRLLYSSGHSPPSPHYSLSHAHLASCYL